MTDDTDDNHEFTTDSSPSEQAFEKKVDDAVAFIERAVTNSDSYGARTDASLRSAVRAAFNFDRSFSPEQVAHELSDQAGRDTGVEPTLRRIEEMIDESGGTAASDAGGI